MNENGFNLMELGFIKRNRWLFILAALAMLVYASWPTIKGYAEQYRENFPKVNDDDGEPIEEGDGVQLSYVPQSDVEPSPEFSPVS
jgi:hypothetical protein